MHARWLHPTAESQAQAHFVELPSISGSISDIGGVEGTRSRSGRGKSSPSTMHSAGRSDYCNLR